MRTAGSVRLDKLLVDRGLAASRERAASLILAGRVMVDEQKVTKAGFTVQESAQLRLLGQDLQYVSRGGLKLQGALDRWQVDLRDRMCVDIGASTGGFTDCMLQRGARGVVAVDTGYGQMAVPLRDDPRLVFLERTNARLLAPGQLSRLAEKLAAGPDARIRFFAMDVSFISATLVLPAVIPALAAASEPWQGEGVVLVKPQFEAGREWVGKGGIVKSAEAHTLAIERVKAAIADLAGTTVDLAESPITGVEGNREFLLLCRFSSVQ